MNYKLLIVFLILFMGCSTIPKKKERFPHVHPKIRPHVEKFNIFYKKYRHSSLHHTLPVKYGQIIVSPTAQGVYYRIRDYTVISSKWWDKLDPYQKEIVVFHELGHHVLKRNHDFSANRILKNGCSRSMMYYQGVSTKCYKKYYGYYIQELFKWSK